MLWYKTRNEGQGVRNEVDEMRGRGKIEGKHPFFPTEVAISCQTVPKSCATCNVILNVMVESKAIDTVLSNNNPSRPTTS